MRRALFIVSLAVAGCGADAPFVHTPAVSSTIALTSDDTALWVVTPDTDSVSVIDPVGRQLIAEVLLAPAPPDVDAAGRFEPAVKPRALAILPDDSKVYVAAQIANAVIVLDAKTHAVLTTIPVAAEPTGVVASPDGKAVYVVSHQGAQVSKIDPGRDRVVDTLSVGEHPWGASVSADAKTLFVTQFLMQPGVTIVDTGSFTVRGTTQLAEQMPDAAGKLVPNGVARGVYTAVPRPVAGDLWLPHLLLAVKTPQPALDFQSTVFPTVSTLTPDGKSESKRLVFKPLTVPGAGGSFSNSISGPRALAFTPDGKLALMANSGSEDVTVFDGETGFERTLVRPLPATFLEGVVVDHAGTRAYVDGRNSHNVVPLAITPTDMFAPVAVDGDPIDRIASDPMPAQLRLGQRLFYTANSSAFPITQNFWVSCSSCHLEGRTDAVTWLFAAGPRDTPSNAGGPINTGFLLRQALRNNVDQYDLTINIEQGGNFRRSNAPQKVLLDALAAFVNQAIPLPQNPNLAAGGALTDAQQRGQTTFAQRCSGCHSGPWLTDSGDGNATLDFAGPILLHNVGTCVQGSAFDDQAVPDDVTGAMHAACDFDTPTLRGIFDSAPYFHDGSAATLRDVVDRLPFSASLSDGEKNDLVAYLKTL